MLRVDDSLETQREGTVLGLMGHSWTEKMSGPYVRQWGQRMRMRLENVARKKRCGSQSDQVESSACQIAVRLEMVMWEDAQR